MKNSYNQLLLLAKPNFNIRHQPLTPHGYNIDYMLNFKEICAASAACVKIRTFREEKIPFIDITIQQNFVDEIFMTIFGGSIDNAIINTRSSNKPVFF